jgi:cell division inhibitor SulA
MEMLSVADGNDASEAPEEILTAAVITFPSSHYAFQAEKAFQEANLPVLLIPLPREIGADCGVSLLIPPQQQEQAEALLSQTGVAWTGIHQITRQRSRARLWRRVLNL